MTPANVPFTTDLASYVLRMCLHQWQDRYNLHKKGMTPMDMHSLQTSFKAIMCVCTQKKAHTQSGEKASQKNEAGTKRPSTGATMQIPKKVNFEKYCKPCKKYGGACTTHTTKDCRRYEKVGMVKANFCAVMMAEKKTNPAKHLFAQLSEKLDMLEKSLKKASLKSKKLCRDNSNFDSK
jgi:hypothetical protein